MAILVIQLALFVFQLSADGFEMERLKVDTVQQ